MTVLGLLHVNLIKWIFICGGYIYLDLMNFMYLTGYK